MSGEGPPSLAVVHGHGKKAVNPSRTGRLARLSQEPSRRSAPPQVDYSQVQRHIVEEDKRMEAVLPRELTPREPSSSEEEDEEGERQRQFTRLACPAPVIVPPPLHLEQMRLNEHQLVGQQVSRALMEMSEEQLLSHLLLQQSGSTLKLVPQEEEDEDSSGSGIGRPRMHTWNGSSSSRTPPSQEEETDRKKTVGFLKALALKRKDKRRRQSSFNNGSPRSGDEGSPRSPRVSRNAPLSPRKQKRNSRQLDGPDLTHSVPSFGLSAMRHTSGGLQAPMSARGNPRKHSNPRVGHRRSTSVGDSDAEFEAYLRSMEGASPKPVRSKRGSRLRRKRGEEESSSPVHSAPAGPFPGITLHGEYVGPALSDDHSSGSSPSLSPQSMSPRKAPTFLMPSSEGSPRMSEMSMEQLRKRVLALERVNEEMQDEVMRWKQLYYSTVKRYREEQQAQRDEMVEWFFSQEGATAANLPNFMRVVTVEENPDSLMMDQQHPAQAARSPHSELQKSLSQPFFMDMDDEGSGEALTRSSSGATRLDSPKGGPMSARLRELRGTQEQLRERPRLSELHTDMSRSQSEGALHRLVSGPVRRKPKSKRVTKTGSMVTMPSSKEAVPLLERMRLVGVTRHQLTLSQVRETDRKAANEYRKYLEGYYLDLFRYVKDRKDRRFTMEDYLRTSSMSPEDKAQARRDFMQRETRTLRARRVQLSMEDFEILTLIGKGAYGKVYLVKKKDSGSVYALKQIEKSLLLEKDQVDSILVEREVLKGTNSPWIVHLHYSFHDQVSLYLAMDYVPGGDLRTVLDQVDLEEDQVRFYSAEMFLAVATLHKWGFVHRDLKPANFLISRDGHLKLTDFGLSKGDLVKEDAKTPVKVYLRDSNYKTLMLTSSATVDDTYQMLESKLMHNSDGFAIAEEVEGKKRRMERDERPVEVMLNWKVGTRNRFVFMPEEDLKERDSKLLSSLGRVTRALVKKRSSPTLPRRGSPDQSHRTTPPEHRKPVRKPSVHMPSQEMIQRMTESVYEPKPKNFSELRQRRKGQQAEDEISNRERYLSVVGSPDYMAIEVLQGKGYERSVDFWAIGAMTYEMFFGFPPFAGETPQEVFLNIVNYESALAFPDPEDVNEVQINGDAKHLISSLLTEPENRLGRVGGIDAIKQHPFYACVDWDNQLQAVPPFVPDLTGKEDHSYFQSPEAEGGVEAEPEGEHEELHEQEPEEEEQEDEEEEDEEEEDDDESNDRGGVEEEESASEL